MAKKSTKKTLKKKKLSQENSKLNIPNIVEDSAKNVSSKNLNNSTNSAKVLEKEKVNNVLLKSISALFGPTILRDRFVAVSAGVFFIWSIGWFSIVTIPDINSQTEDSKLFREQKEAEETEKKKAEDANQEAEFFKLGFENLEAQIATNQGNLNFNLNYSAAPKTVENFARLGFRDYFDKTIFHKAVKTDTAFTIQGGAPESKESLDGILTGETATGDILIDEIWEVEPIYDQKDNKTVIINDPKLAYSDFYSSFNKEAGTIKYRKGLIIMAKTNQPDSATSQFFITLADSILPADYTVFGEIKEDSLETLNKLAQEIVPVQDYRTLGGDQVEVSDGFLSKEVKIESLEIIKN